MKIKKLMSGLLAFAMAASMLTIPAFAAELTPTGTASGTIHYSNEKIVSAKFKTADGVTTYVASGTVTQPASGSETLSAWTTANFAPCSQVAAIPTEGWYLLDETNYGGKITLVDLTIDSDGSTVSAATNVKTLEIKARDVAPLANHFKIISASVNGSDGKIVPTSPTNLRYRLVSAGTYDGLTPWGETMTAAGITNLRKDDAVLIRYAGMIGGAEKFPSANLTLKMTEGTDVTKEAFELVSSDAVPVYYTGSPIANAGQIGTIVKATDSLSSTVVDANIEIIIKDKDGVDVTADALNAGTYKVFAKGKATNVFSETEVEVATLVVKPAEITGVDFAAGTLTTKKAYDGNNKFKATLADTETTITGVVASEKLVIAVEGTLDAANKLTVTKAELKDGTDMLSNYVLATGLNLVTQLNTNTNKNPIVPTDPKLIKVRETISVSGGDAIPTVGETLTLTLEGIGLIGNDELVLGTDYTVQWTHSGSSISGATGSTHTIAASENTSIIRATIGPVVGSNYTFAQLTTDSVQVGKKTIPKPILKSSTGATINPYVDKLLPGDYTIEVPGLILGTDYVASAITNSGQGGTVAGNILTIASGDAGKSVLILAEGSGTYGTNRTFEYYTVASGASKGTVVAKGYNASIVLTFKGHDGNGTPITGITYDASAAAGATGTGIGLTATMEGGYSVTLKGLTNDVVYTLDNIKLVNAMGASTDKFDGILCTPTKNNNSFIGGGSYSGSSSSSNKSFIIDAKLPANATATSVKIGAEVPAEVTNVPSSATIVADTKPITAEMAKRAGGFGIKQALSINLFDGTTKITTVEGGKVKVTLPFAGTAGKQYVVLRYNADGTTSVIPATYADGNITFTTNRFGTDFAIAEVGGTTVVGGTTTGTTTGKVPQTGIVALAPLF